MTKELDTEFNALLNEFMQKLLEQSHLQVRKIESFVTKKKIVLKKCVPLV